MIMSGWLSYDCFHQCRIQCLFSANNSSSTMSACLLRADSCDDWLKISLLSTCSLIFRAAYLVFIVFRSHLDISHFRAQTIYLRCFSFARMHQLSHYCVVTKDTVTLSSLVNVMSLHWIFASRRINHVNSIKLRAALMHRASTLPDDKRTNGLTLMPICYQNVATE
jgi:hypothetical protein